MGDRPDHDDAESELSLHIHWLLETTAGRGALTAAVSVLALAIHGIFGLIVALAGTGWTLARVVRRLERKKPDPIAAFERERAERAALVFRQAPLDEPPERR
jgi:hypothetical protein